MPLGNCPASARPTTSSQRSRGWRTRLAGSLATSLPPAATARARGAGCRGAGGNRGGGGPTRRAASQPIGGPASLDTADEALQPLLLLVVEFAHVTVQAATRAGTRWRAYRNSSTAARQRAYSVSVASSSLRRGRGR